jgi:hypothetical protein
VTPRSEPRACALGALGALVALVSGGALTIGAPPVEAAGEIKPGAYCALPKPGETPHCLDPAKSEYSSFFTALDEGTPDDADAARIEADVTGQGDPGNAYLALSSIAYGYFRLSQRASEAPNVDPEIAARLERWNRILALAYAHDPDDADFRGAVREAVTDLSQNAPRVTLRCVDAAGTETACDSTEVVLRGVDATAGEVGLRGALSHLLERVLGNGAE